MATIVTRTIKPSGGDYTSLSAAEAGEQRDLVTQNEIAVFECYSMADTARVLVDGWITDSTHYIRIYTPASERHDGKWNTAKYRLEPPAVWYTALDIREGYTEVDGLQIKRATASGSTNKPCIMLYAGATDCTISNCILTTDGVTAYGVDIGTSITNTYIYNCLIYDFANQGIMGYSNAFIYNNTIVNCGTGISKSSGQSGTTWTCKNVLVSGSTGNDFEMLSGTGAVTYCASSDATADDWGGASNRINQTFTFVDTVNKDFHLASGDAGAKDFGADLSADPNIPFSVDIDGETRSGAWDIGSDEYVAAGGVIIPVSGSTAGLSAVAGLAGMAYNAAGTAIGLSGINALAGLGYIVSGSAAAVSLPYASAGIVRGVNGGLNGLSLLSGAISTYALTALAGNISTLSVLNGVAGLTFHVSGPAAGTSSFLASAGLSSLITGSASGASYFTAALTGLSANNFSGQINTISTFAGNVAMRYGLGGASPSALLLTGHLYEIYSSAGLFQAYSSLTGSPLFAGQISPASRAGSPRLDVTRYGGGTLPLMQSDSDIVTVTQDNNNPRVTR